MSEECLKQKILEIIYGGKWHFQIGGGPGAEYYEVDEFFLENEGEVIQKIIEAVSGKPEKRNIRESLVFAISTSVKGKSASTTARLIIQEFYQSLNRKLILTNNEAEQEIAEAIKQLNDLGENWKYVAI